MNKILILFILMRYCIFFFLALLLCANSDNLELVFHLMGSTSHSPHIGFLSEYFPEGRQEITNIGKRQAYLLGKLTNYKYVQTIPLLKPIYNSSEIYSRSNYHNVSIDVAQSFMSGFYEGTGAKLSPTEMNNPNNLIPPWVSQVDPTVIQVLQNSSLPFDITPYNIQVYDQSADNLLFLESNCSKYSSFVDSVIKGPNFKKLLTNNDQFINQICSNLEIDCSNLKEDPTQIYLLLDAIINLNSTNRKLPWMTSDFMANIGVLFNSLANCIYVDDTRLNNLTKNGYNQFVLDYISKKINNTIPIKYIFLSGERRTILSLLYQFGNMQATIIPLGTSLTIEMYKRESPTRKPEDFYLRIYLIDTQITVPNLGSDIAYTSFLSFMQTRTLSQNDYAKACQSAKSSLQLEK